MNSIIHLETLQKCLQKHLLVLYQKYTANVESLNMYYIVLH